MNVIHNTKSLSTSLNLLERVDAFSEPSDGLSTHNTDSK